ncbi:hypothetical protein [Lonsdalea iberica]|uniref:hypothetical protein n=1 Tax=Lonsdalea iberica TaxID=1082703 RepID=UPI002689AA1B
MEYLLVKPEDIRQASKMVKESMEIYNPRRPHRSLNTTRPIKFIGVLELKSVNLYHDRQPTAPRKTSMISR